MKVIDLGPVEWEEACPPSGTGTLADGGVELVLVPCAPSPETIPFLRSLLTPDERAAAERYRIQAFRERAVASRAVLRLLLSSYAGIPPGLLGIAAERRGKPFLARGKEGRRTVAFNLSHSGDFLLYAFARADVGVDIECVRPMPGLAAFTEVSLGTRELARYAALPDDRKLAYVYRAWVCKEAVAKLAGEGLEADFASIELEDEADAAEADRPGIGVRLFAPAADYVAAIAALSSPSSLRFRRVSRVEDLISATMEIA